MNYLELNYADEPAEQRKLLAGVWHHAHAVAKNKGLQFGVSFPFWMDPVKTEQGTVLKAGTFGPIMRIFASDAALKVFAQELSQSRAIQAGFIGMSDIRCTPAHATLERYRRSRLSDRAAGGYALRQQKQLQRRALLGKSCQYQIDPVELVKKAQAEKMNFLSMRSKENGNGFSLNVVRHPAAGAADVSASNSYGLGGIVPAF